MMKITEQQICEYLFNLLSPEMNEKVAKAIDVDQEVRNEYLRLKNKFDRLKLLEPEYTNPLVGFGQFLMKQSAIVAVLALIFSLWFLSNQAHAKSHAALVENHYEAQAVKMVCCTSGISPQKSPEFNKNFDEILAKNIQLTSSIDTEMNYSSQYLRKLSL